MSVVVNGGECAWKVERKKRENVQAGCTSFQILFFSSLSDTRPFYPCKKIQSSGLSSCPVMLLPHIKLSFGFTPLEADSTTLSKARAGKTNHLDGVYYKTMFVMKENIMGKYVPDDSPEGQCPSFSSTGIEKVACG